MAEPGADSAARARLVRAYDEAREADDIDAMADAALALASGHLFGTVPGRVPAFLYEAYRRSDGKQRARLALAVARSWAYGYHPERAVTFAAEALAFAEEHDDPSLLAQALDAQLLVSWGPDDFDQRRRITARLEDIVAHQTDTEARLSAYLWRLTTALECLDLPAVRRQLRALDTLAAETGSPRVRYFAAARRAMDALLADDLPAVEPAISETLAAGAEAGEPDTIAMEHVLTAALARQRGDLDMLRHEAAAHEDFGVREGVRSVVAEATVFFAELGEHERARSLLRQVANEDFSDIPRDVDYLLTLVSATAAAVLLDERTMADQAIPLLAPYSGRGVVNAGGVLFAGVVDDYLQQACALLGRDDETRLYGQQAGRAYGRMRAVVAAPRGGGPSGGIAANDALARRAPPPAGRRRSLVGRARRSHGSGP